jgi:hypothetical protein
MWYNRYRKRKEKLKGDSKMTITEMIAHLEELRATHGDVEFVIRMDDGTAVCGDDIDVRLEEEYGETTLAFYR